MTKPLLGITMLAALASAGRAEAQLPLGLPLSVEVRAGAGLPVGDFAESDPGVGAEAGVTVGAGAAFHLSRAVAVFAGYSQTRFGCGECGERGIEDHIIDRGGDFGLQVQVPAILSRYQPALRVGGIYHELEFSGFGGSEAAEPALGFMIGGEILLPLVRSLALIPEIGYRSYSAELELGGLENQTVEVSYLSLGARLSYRFR